MPTYAATIRAELVKAKADLLANDMLVGITVARIIGDDGSGDETWDTAESFDVLVEYGVESMTDQDGRTVPISAQVLFMEQVADKAESDAGFTRQQPFDIRDKFTLPDGRTSFMVVNSGTLGNDTDKPYVMEVGLGEPSR